VFINMKGLLFYIALIITLTANSQNKNDVNNFMGLYFGGQSYGGSMDGIGYYYFNPDSSFIFIRTGLNQNVKTKEFKDRFNDTLVGYGKGHWYIKDNFLLVRFEAISDENIQNGKLKYMGYSKAPFDSLFLNINVTNYDDETFGMASIIFSAKNIGSVTDSLGFSKAALSKSGNLGDMLISKPGYSDMSIALPNNFNIHEFSITLAKSDHSNVDLVSKVEYTF